MSILATGNRVFQTEIEALLNTKNILGSQFEAIAKLITECKGKVIVTGMGKSGHIASKIAATFSSLGTPSFFMHPAEAMHGDIGMVSEDDVVIAISNSGESEEIIRIIPSIKFIGARLIGFTGTEDSTLAKSSDMSQIFPNIKEACSLGLAPTSSTTVMLCYGDALAIAVSEEKGFRNVDFATFHPAGSLGKKLLTKVCDIMSKNENNAKVYIDSSFKEAIIELSKKGLGMVSVVDTQNCLKGIITDGDLRRLLEKGVDVYSLNVKEIMTTSPIVVSQNLLAVDALNIMRNRNISNIPVIEKDILVGTIRLQDILRAGIIA